MLIGETAPAADAPPSSSIGSSLSEAMITCEIEGVHKGVAEASQQAARDARARLRYRGREPEAASPVLMSRLTWLMRPCGADSAVSATVSA